MIKDSEKELKQHYFLAEELKITGLFKDLLDNSKHYIEHIEKYEDGVRVEYKQEIDMNFK